MSIPSYEKTVVVATAIPIPLPPRVASNNPDEMADDETIRDEKREALHARRDPNREGAFNIVKDFITRGFGGFMEPQCTAVRHKWRRSKHVLTIREHTFGDCGDCRNDIGKKMIENLVKGRWVLGSWGGDDSADVTRFEGEGAAKRLNSWLRRGPDRYMKLRLTEDRFVVMVPKRLPLVARTPIWGEDPVTACAQLVKIFTSETCHSGHAITFDKKTAEEIKAAPFSKASWVEKRERWLADKADADARQADIRAIEADEAPVGDFPIAPDQSPVGKSPTGCASNNPDDMVDGRRYRGSPVGAGGERVEPEDEPCVIAAREALDAAEGDPYTSAEEVARLRLRADAEHDLATALRGQWDPWGKSSASQEGTADKVRSLGGTMLRYKWRRFSYTPSKASQKEFDGFLSTLVVDDCTDYSHPVGAAV